MPAGRGDRRGRLPACRFYSGNRPCASASELNSIDVFIGCVDDDAVDVDAEPFLEHRQGPFRRPARFVFGPGGELKLENPAEVFLDPLLQVVGGAVRLGPGDDDLTRGEVGVAGETPVHVRLRTGDGDGRAVYDSHLFIVVNGRRRP